MRKKYTTFSTERIVALRSVNKIFPESYDIAAKNKVDNFYFEKYLKLSSYKNIFTNLMVSKAKFLYFKCIELRCDRNYPPGQNYQDQSSL
jgi:hypothetical protein